LKSIKENMKILIKRNKKIFNHILLGSIFNFILGACYSKGDQIKPNKVFAGDSVTLSNVSYDNYIHDLLKKNCSTCHGEGGGADVWWLNDNTYENAVRNSNPITTTIINGTMPPPPKFPFLEKDRELLKAWVDNGLPLK
jgi:hypothetical protein